MRQNMYVFERPRVCPEYARVSSKLSKAPRAVRYISGKATTAAASTPPYHVITNLMPYWARNMPRGRLAPKTRSMK